MKFARRFVALACAAALSLHAAPIRAQDATGAVHQVEQSLDDAALDLEGDTLPDGAAERMAHLLEPLRALVHDPTAVTLIDGDGALTPAGQVGAARARLQHIIALEMLRAQRDGQAGQTREWRSLITLPRYADGEENAILLQTASDEQLRQPAVTRALAREYVSWQCTHARQMLDYMGEGIRRGDATENFVARFGADVTTLVRFPAALFTDAELPGQTKAAPAVPALQKPLDTPQNLEPLAYWRQEVEGTLPNLLTESDVARLQRLLARFVKLIPKEYSNGVSGGKVIIALEYREATQFTQQAQALVNELGPVWQRDQPQAYTKRHRELVDKFEGLRIALAAKAGNKVIDEKSRDLSDILEGDFRLSARRAGDKGDVVEETALEVRVALTNSLAAAKADQWQEAESQRLDAYTAFDTEIEPRVLPRDPKLALSVERAFIDGAPPEVFGIKALLDRRAPMDELEKAYGQTIEGLDSSVGLLKTAVSPATLSFTAFTIIAREGMEAVVVLAALMAGLRGVEQAGTRRGIANGAWLALVATGLTFWLSKTVVQSLAHYGEKLEAVVSVLAVAILFVVTNWVFHKFYWVGWNAKIRSLTKSARAVEASHWEKFALLGVGFLTVYREGFETALFMQSLVLEGNPGAVVTGAGIGVVFIALVGGLTFTFGVKLPYRKLLVVTGVLVVSILVSFLGSTVRLFQTVGWLSVHPVPGLHIPAWSGLWLGLYPSWEGLLIPPLSLVWVGGAWLWTKWSSSRHQPSVLPVAPKRAEAREPQTAHV